ncbi:hypothetical protein BD626DRAFT_395734 [Schizophyllum amplum]|uniref:Peroxisomal biogenesis factor 11 n=1 Tax=Schizophyllum amplum TaxID=97359 RepID=A0A550CTY9_9AGAR|nr:hypothetical protein BD626DRAFT_395734 [Auriculariopsis ampla]
MSGISFPGNDDSSDNDYAFANASGAGNGFPGQGFQVGSTSGGGASSGFQINPLSSHPPRTPRSSIISSSTYVYGASVYEDAPSHAMAEKVEVTEDIYDPADEPDDDNVHTSAAAKHIRREDVWREMIVTSDGRDKAFKLIQYTIRTYLLFHNPLVSRMRWKAPWVKRLEDTASGLSFSRKTLLLFNWLAPLTTIMSAQQAVPFSSDSSRLAAPPLKEKGVAGAYPDYPSRAKTAAKSAALRTKPFLHALLYAPPPVLLELVHSMADDAATFARLGLFSQKFGDRAGRFSDWCWLFATLAGLVENAVERNVIVSLKDEGESCGAVQGRLYAESMSGTTARSLPRASKHDERELGRLDKRDYWLTITRTKLLMDLIFVSYDIFRVKRGKKSVQTFAGLTSGVLSSMKLFDRHRGHLLKKASSM